MPPAPEALDDTVTPSQEHHFATQEAIGAALQAAEARGADRKHIRTGLWQAAIGTLLATGDLDTIVGFLEDRMAKIRGHGHNADSPPLRHEPKDTALRKEHSTLLAEIVVGHLEPLMDVLERQHVDGVSLVADTVFTILSDRWGPVHLRRTIAEQIAAFRSGDASIILPLEPSTPNRPKTTPAPARVEAAPAQPDEPLHTAPAPQVVAVRPGLNRSSYRVEIHARTDVDPDIGIGVYGVAIQLIDPVSGRQEVREIDGIVHNDRNGRRTVLSACLDALSSLGGVDDDEISISSTAQFIVDEMSVPQLSGISRLEHEADLWQQIDDWTHGRNVSWLLSNSGIGSPLAQRSDRLVRDRLEAEAANRKA